jgi:hypothetical protein
MKRFIVYSLSDGKILRTGICPNDVMQLQTREENGEGVIEGTADDMKHFVDIDTKEIKEIKSRT